MRDLSKFDFNLSLLDLKDRAKLESFIFSDEKVSLYSRLISRRKLFLGVKEKVIKTLFYKTRAFKRKGFIE